MPEVKSLFAKEKEALHAMKGPPRHPRHGGTFMSSNQRQPANVSIMRNAPRRPTLPLLATQKPKTKLMVRCLEGCKALIIIQMIMIPLSLPRLWRMSDSSAALDQVLSMSHSCQESCQG